jgi:hypothetical protein
MAAILGLESWIYCSDFEEDFNTSYQVSKFIVRITVKIVASECKQSLFIIVGFGVQMDFEICLLQLITHSLWF